MSKDLNLFRSTELIHAQIPTQHFTVLLQSNKVRTSVFTVHSGCRAIVKMGFLHMCRKNKLPLLSSKIGANFR